MGQNFKKYGEKFTNYAKQGNRAKNAGTASAAVLFGGGAAVVGALVLNGLLLELLANTQLPQIATQAIAIASCVAAVIVAAALAAVATRLIVNKIFGNKDSKKSGELPNPGTPSQADKVDSQRKNSVASGQGVS